MKIIDYCPSIPITFDANLISMSTFGFSAKYLYQISVFLQKKMDSAKFRKFPTTISKLKLKQQQFQELYERAKIEEEEAKTKLFIKTLWLGYRPRLVNRNDQSVFDRLNDRAEASKREFRKNKKVSKA